MKKEDAVDKLRQLDEKIMPLDSLGHSQTVEIASYIKQYFTKDSPEYQFIEKQIHFAYKFGAADKDEVRIFLGNCMSKIEDHGIKEEPKVNFLYTMNKLQLIGLFTTIAIALIGGSFLIGRLFPFIEYKEDVNTIKESVNEMKDISEENAKLIKELQVQLSDSTVR